MARIAVNIRSVVIGGFFGLAYLFGERITGLIQSTERGFTAVVIAVMLAALAAMAWGVAFPLVVIAAAMIGMLLPTQRLPAAARSTPARRGRTPPPG